MQRVEESSKATAGGATGQQGRAAVQGRSHERAHASAAASSDYDQLLAHVQRLTAENERYRAHAERTSKLFLAATNYAEWVRESARRAAEDALRKARARVTRLESTARDLERAESEHARLQDELVSLQAVIDETRTRLSAFLAAGLDALNIEAAVRDASQDEGASAELQDTLHRQAASTSSSASASRLPAEGESRER